MLLKNYILITDADSEEALQKKLGLSAFWLIFLKVWELNSTALLLRK